MLIGMLEKMNAYQWCIHDRRAAMQHLRSANNRLVGLLAVLLLTAGGMMAAAHTSATPKALAADHVIACIRTAVAAQPGLVKEVEAEYERGQWLCEVKLVDDAGKRHKLHVDVATNQVVKTK
jgi:hypothetical protein